MRAGGQRSVRGEGQLAVVEGGQRLVSGRLWRSGHHEQL